MIGRSGGLVKNRQVVDVDLAASDGWRETLRLHPLPLAPAQRRLESQKAITGKNSPSIQQWVA